MTKIILGFIVVFFGLSLIFSELFKIDFPFFKILFAILIIFFGVKLLFGSVGMNINKGGERTSLFSSTRIDPQNLKENQEYNCIFGSQTVDLRQTGINSDEIELEVNAIFGETKLYLPKTVKVRLKSSAVFGNVSHPDGSSVSFGDRKYKSTGEEGSLDQYIEIEANAVFGSVRVYQ